MTMIQPTDSELAEGIAPWNDSPTVVQSAPEFPQDMSQLATFELDREARSNAHYLSKLLAHRDSGHARINGSIGCTSIVPVGAPVNVSRGAW